MTTKIKASNIDTAATDFTFGTMSVDGNLTVTGNLTIEGSTITVDTATVQTVSLGDNDKISLGDSADLQIYHNGTHSFIKDVGTGNLYIDATSLYVRSATGEPYIVGTADAGVSIYYDNALKLATTATGIDVTGTVEASDALFNGAIAGRGLIIDTATEGVTDNVAILNAQHSAGILSFKTNSIERVRINSSGNVGIGTTSPAAKLHVEGTSKFTDYIYGGASDIVYFISNVSVNANKKLYLDNGSNTYLSEVAEDTVNIVTNGTERLRIDASGNIGIGTTSPDRVLHLNNSGTEQNVRAKFTNGTTGEGASDGFEIGINASNPAEVVLVNYEASPMAFFTSGSERLRIDSSGNLLVGKSVTDIGTVGFRVDGSNGFATITRDSYEPLILNRLTSDGDIATFRKDGTTVGSIGVAAGGINVNSQGGDFAIRRSGTDVLYVGATASYPGTDNGKDLGVISYRWKDLYLSGGVSNPAAGGTLTFSTVGTERMRIDSSGRVGLGTSSPGRRLHVLFSNSTAYNSSSFETDSLGSYIRNTDTTVGSYVGMQFAVGNNSDAAIAAVRTADANAALTFGTRGTGSGAIIERMRISSTGNVGIGTSSPSGELDVTASKASAVTNLYVRNPDNTGGAAIRVQSQTDAHQAILGITDAGSGGRVGTLTNDDFYFVTNNTERLRINTSGNVGIGLTSPIDSKLVIVETPATIVSGNAINGSTMKGLKIRTNANGDESVGVWFGTNGSHWSGISGQRKNAAGTWGTNLSFYTHEDATTDLTYTRERMTIDSAGNVGIGTTVNSLFNAVGGSTKLAVTGSSASTNVLGNTDASIAIINTDTTANNTAGLHFARADTDDNPNYAGASIVTQFHDTQATGQYPKASMNFLTSTVANAAPSLKMTIDSSGNLLVGTTSTIPFTFSSGTGAGITSAGTVMAGATAEAGLFNRIGSDGGIVNFYKAGAIVGSIGALSSRLYIGTAGTGLFFNNSSGAITPYDVNGQTQTDADVDLGVGSVRFKDLYLSGGVYLGGTGSANHLDDYEEGTFTPTLGGTTTYNGAGGFYTKVGQVVSVQCFVNIASLNTPKNGNHYIQGLPFASSGQESYMGVHYFYNCAVNMSYLAFRATGYDMWPTFAGSPSGSMGVNPAIFQNNTQVYIAGVYRTTQ